VTQPVLKRRRPERLNLTDYTLVNRGYQTECWEWNGSLADHGYGRIRRENKWYRAHRMVYESVKGKIPDGLQLDHLCRNPACVNPDHLEPVTNAINTRRGAKPKLCEQQVVLILSDKRTSTTVAKKFGVTETTIRQIRNGSRWKDVRDEYIREHGSIGPWDNPKLRLTMDQADTIRLDRRIHALIAADYGVSRQTISDIKCGNRWVRQCAGSGLAAQIGEREGRAP